MRRIDKVIAVPAAAVRYSAVVVGNRFLYNILYMCTVILLLCAFCTYNIKVFIPEYAESNSHGSGVGNSLHSVTHKLQDYRE